MDIIHAGYDVAGLLEPSNPLLTMLCIRGPLRHTKNAFLADCMRRWGVRSLLDVGGGQGGDCGLWVRLAVRDVLVVDVDPNALEEYARRLAGSYHASGVGPDWHVPGGADGSVACRWRLVVADWRGLDPGIGAGADAAVLDFSASQIVGGRGGVVPLLRALCVDRGIPHVALVVHDHAAAGPAPPNPAHGVVCAPLDPATGDDCPRRRGRPTAWCVCPHTDHGAARLHTRVVGTRMAAGIHEWAFDADAFVNEVRRAVVAKELPAGLRVECHRPFQRPQGADVEGDVHWLLRTLTLLRVDNPRPRI